ncbi:AraC family transcriptional regulator [Amnibacterium kyonggiense]
MDGGGSGPRTDPLEGAERSLLLPRVERAVYRGADGLRRLPIEGRFESRDAAAFEAEVVRARFGDIVLRRTSITAHRAVVDGSDSATDEDILRLLTVRRGEMIAVPPGGAPVRVGAGDALLTCRPRRYAYRADGPLVVVASTVPVSSLPRAVRRLDRLPVGPLPHAPLVDAVVDLLTELAERLHEPWAFDADYAARGVIDLETAILTGLLAPARPMPGPARVHAAAVDYIERHLGERDLRPPQIADALGVSLRYLHRAFDDEEMTVAKHLRERRLERVAAALRSERTPGLERIADRYGFASQDQLARAFRRRYGVSMTEYRGADRR